MAIKVDRTHRQTTMNGLSLLPGTNPYQGFSRGLIPALRNSLIRVPSGLLLTGPDLLITKVHSLPLGTSVQQRKSCKPPG